MKLINENIDLNIKCVIEKDKGIGFYLYVYDMKSGKCIKDHLQDTLNLVKEQAEEEYGIHKSRDDELGHFAAVFRLDSPVQGNNACLTMKLSTQLLSDLSNEIREVVQRERDLIQLKN